MIPEIVFNAIEAAAPLRFGSGAARVDLTDAVLVMVPVAYIGGKPTAVDAILYTEGTFLTEPRGKLQLV